MEDQGLAATAGDCAPAGDQGGHSVIISGGVRQTCGHHPAAEEKRLKSDKTHTLVHIKYYLEKVRTVASLTRAKSLSWVLGS